MNNQQIHQSVLALSTDLRKEANEVADAAYNALSAGVDTGNMLNFTAQASKLATAGFTDTATSVDVLTTILNAYKMESSQTEKVASTLVKTQDLGKVTVDQMAKVMGRVIPSAAAYGVNLDNIAAAYANMTAAGINAENTTTYLSTMLDELADSGSNVSKVLIDQTGKTFAELMTEGNSLADVLAIIGESVDNDQVKFSNLWASATAGKAAISLFDGSAASFNATLQEMANSSGTVEKNYRKMTDVSEYSSQRLEVASKNLSIIVGDQLNPILDKLRESGAGILEVAADVVAENPMLVSVISGLVVGVGALATGLSALMIVKSVTAAMAALNITSREIYIANRAYQ
jgi:TP901 family phage tail tape measure protein